MLVLVTSKDESKNIPMNRYTDHIKTSTKNQIRHPSGYFPCRFSVPACTTKSNPYVRHNTNPHRRNHPQPPQKRFPRHRLRNHPRYPTNRSSQIDRVPLTIAPQPMANRPQISRQTDEPERKHRLQIPNRTRTVRLHHPRTDTGRCRAIYRVCSQNNGVQHIS